MGHLDDDVSPLFPKGLSLHIKLSLFVALSLGLMFIDTRYELLRPLHAALSALTTPVQLLAEAPQALGRLAHYFASRDALLKENEALRLEQLQLQVRLQKLAALEGENRRIRALLQSSRQLDERMLIAEIVAVSNDPYRHSIRLNKGSQNGVFVGQALVDAHGVMGQVTEVTPYGAQALLITDPNHGIPVEISRNGLRTIARGEGGPGLSLPYLPGNADIQAGDELVTSGLGGRYPPGYPVGTVTEVRHRPGEYFLDIVATPAAHLDRGREVLLVWRESTAADPASAGKPTRERAAGPRTAAR